MSVNDKCPCCSGKLYSSCCEPFITGKGKPITAEELMRSRYTANVIKNADYLLLSWHPSKRPEKINAVTIPDFNGLEIIRTEAGREGDIQGIVEFKAKSTSQKGIWVLHETSRFVKEKDQWLYLNGKVHEPPSATTKKVGRNDPCSCSSGKKFKKCCGSA